jgi:hypothetical protein
MEPITTIEQYNEIINAAPPEDKIKQNPDGSLYLPISYIQPLLYEIYQGYTKMELIRETIHGKGITGVGRLHYKHPISNEWLYQDGSAGLPHGYGLRLDLPSLGTHIMLNAVKKIGNCFGQSLNRDREDLPVEQEVEINIEADRVKVLIDNATDLKTLAVHKDAASKYGLMKEYMNKAKSFA